MSKWKRTECRTRMRKRTLISGILAFGVFVLITGCSYREFEDSLRSALKGETEEFSDYVNDASINTESDSEKDRNVYYVGDTAKIVSEETDESGNSIFIDREEYTLNHVDLVKDVNELGISMTDFSASFSNQDKISKDGKLQEGYSFITANISVKNISNNISNTMVDDASGCNMCIAWEAAAESSILDPAGIIPLQCAYFSGHHENVERYYYLFSLAVGEEKNYTVGWVVSDQMLEEPFYYIVNGGSYPEFQKYFLLNEEK